MTQFDDDDRNATAKDPAEPDGFDDYAPDRNDVRTQDDPNYQIGSASAPQQPQAKSIGADYYAILDTEDWPIAGFVILVDRRRQAVRAELHLYEDGERQNEYALHQAQGILANQYYSSDPVQLQVMQSYPWRETLEVNVHGAQPSPQTDVMAIFQDYWQYIVGAAALLLLIFFIWLIASFFGSSDSPETDVADTPAQTVVQEASTGEDAAADAVAPTPVPVLGEQTNGLGPSANADPNLAIGKRARVQPGYTVSLVSEPVPDQELVVGFWEEGQEGLLIDGPVRKQGNSDTIVWWRVRLDNGTEAWAPANTSDAMLLRAID